MDLRTLPGFNYAFYTGKEYSLFIYKGLNPRSLVAAWYSLVWSSQAQRQLLDKHRFCLS